MEVKKLNFEHVSVLFNEAIDSLKIKDSGIYVDGTLGGGGHSSGILGKNSSCKLIGIDQDRDALEAASKRLAPFGERFTAVKSNFRNIKEVLSNQGIAGIDGALLDLGVSSYQLDNGERGFSYMHDAPLDMRMNQDESLTAEYVVNSYDKGDLLKIFYEYGEEKWSKRIVEFICEKRAIAPIKTTGELSSIISAAIPKAAQTGGHPAKRVFQAIRIEVNGELRILKQAISDFVDCLNPGGRLAIITFHSLEDRIVKLTMKELATSCICPKEFPICVCNHKRLVIPVTRKPILPTKEEIEENSRSKSAKLRVVEKVDY